MEAVAFWQYAICADWTLPVSETFDPIRVHVFPAESVTDVSVIEVLPQDTNATSRLPVVLAYDTAAVVAAVSFVNPAPLTYAIATGHPSGSR